jgi:hypothetical protein
MTASIPDFTVTPREATWEKVSSANKGDDDYVPLVDYTKLKGSPETTTTMNTSSSATNNSTPSDVSFENNVDEVDDIMAMNSTTSTPTSRVAAFRAQKRKLRRRRRRRLQMAFMALVIVTACSYFLFNKRSGDTNLQAVVNDDVVQFLEDIVEDGLSDETGGAANLVERECIVEYSGEVSVGCENDLVGVRKEIPVVDTNTLWGLQDVVEQGNQVDCDSGGDDSDISDEEIKQEAEVNDKSSNHEGMEDVDEIKAITTMDNKLQTETLPEEVEKSIELNAENSTTIYPILQKRCKNLFHKIFNKKCRKKKQKKKGGPMSINLQAIAGI